MKFCVHNNISQRYINQADEIKFPYSQYNILINKCLENKLDNTKIYILTIPYDLDDKNKEINWNELTQLNILLLNNLVLCLNRYDLINKAKENNIKYYMNFEVHTYYEFNALIEAGVQYIKIGAPLIFSCDFLEQYKNKIRFVPNVAYTGIKRKDGVCGQWIRPEDVNLYENYIGVLEFEEKTPEAEEAMLRIYKEQKNWPGKINTLIHNFDYEGLNRLIPEDKIQGRLFCRQRCQSGGSCKLCYRIVDLSQEHIYKNYLKNS